MTVTRTYPDKTCERCRSRYVPTGANQKVCAECRARPAKPVQTARVFVRSSGRPHIPYDIPLGGGEFVHLVLPADMTQAEADRICGVIQTLPFPDPAERHPEDPDKPAEQE